MTTTDALIARAQAVLSAADGFTGRFFYQPAHTVDRGIGDCADYCAVDGALVYISHDCDCEDASLIDRDDVTEIGAIDKIIADPMAAILNDAPAVIRDLLARLADQARGLTVGAPEIERIILDDPLSEIDAAAEELDPGHILRVNREQRVEIARMRAEIARMRGMLASNRRDFTDGWVACAEYRGVDIDHDALERALDAELAPAERGPR